MRPRVERVVWLRSGCRNGEGPGRQARCGIASCGACHSRSGVWSGSFVPSSLTLSTGVVKCFGSVLLGPPAGVVVGLVADQGEGDAVGAVCHGAADDQALLPACTQ